jgi:hypothetical protein
LKVMAYDPKRREYYTPFRDDVRGRFPILVKRTDKGGTFQVNSLNKTEQPQTLDYSFEFGENSRPKVTRVTPKEGGKKR